MKKCEENNMKKLLSPYIDRGTWKNFVLVPLGGRREGEMERFAKYNGGGKRKDMKHINLCLAKYMKLEKRSASTTTHMWSYYSY